MDDVPDAYDARYLGGILFFNARDFFEAHEVWEDVWMTCTGPERRFYQALIQAAVALYHFGNGNLRGASKLYKSSHAYMEPFAPRYLGLDINGFWNDMAACFTDVFADPNPDRRVPLIEERIPTITLDPAPAEWPDPAAFATEND